jgi:hypothetical protein
VVVTVATVVEVEVVTGRAVGMVEVVKALKR